MYFSVYLVGFRVVDRGWGEDVLGRGRKRNERKEKKGGVEGGRIGNQK